MAQSVEEQLEQTLESIRQVEKSGQRYTIKDRELWRGDLKVLDKRAERLERASARAKNGGVKIQRIIPL
ncbi:hypothetical protein [Bradyrhizobium retamae]|jgi:hypothetical protein|uniref:Uncharacterized protein n=1 Tax=Bradyrhizobium retamae TaxID=1300035 RepID=A0A0R3MN91_9BRAD|nr:hypothetical protein [Bradyrhizobium retamae]KRR21700.1 hypothetical protein CQ13_06515 [Bradyrhizobium retamae]